MKFRCLNIHLKNKTEYYRKRKRKQGTSSCNDWWNTRYKEQPEFFDATDAMAVALCHHFQKGKPVSKGKSYSGWKDFITENPDRVKSS